MAQKQKLIFTFTSIGFLQFDSNRDKRVVIISRVSSREQMLAGNLDDQESVLVKAVLLPSVIVYKEQVVCPANKIAWFNTLRLLAVKTKRLNACLLFEMICRAIRPENYNPKIDAFEEPSESDYKRLLKALNGCPVRFLKDPESGYYSRSEQTKRGMMKKNAKPGRPRKSYGSVGRHLKSEWFEYASELRKQGMSYRKIAKVLEEKTGRLLTHVAVMRWFKNVDIE